MLESEMRCCFLRLEVGGHFHMRWKSGVTLPGVALFQAGSTDHIEDEISIAGANKKYSRLPRPLPKRRRKLGVELIGKKAFF